MPKEAAHPVDVFVGQQVAEHRRAAKLSQSALARALGITFQQVQKYERGLNRISSSKLWTIAETLNQPISAFFPAPANSDVTIQAASPANLTIGRAAADLSPRHEKLILEVIWALAPRRRPRTPRVGPDNADPPARA